MARHEILRALSGSYVDLTWYGEELSAALIDAIEQELSPVMAAMEAEAKQLCPVGKNFKPTPMRRHLSHLERKYKTHDPNVRTVKRKYDMYDAKLRSKPISVQIRHKRLLQSMEKKRGGDEKWKSREPGRLRDSIRASVHPRHDRTAVIGYLEAGDRDAFYAPFVEFGTTKMKAQPFLRPAFNHHQRQAVEAINLAVGKIGKDD